MASASSTSARSLFGESKSRLADRVQVNINNIASVARHIQTRSKPSEVMSSIRTFAHQCEHPIENTDNNIKKLQLITSHLGYQQESIARSCTLLEEVKEQAQAMQR